MTDIWHTADIQISFKQQKNNVNLLSNLNNSMQQ